MVGTESDTISRRILSGREECIPPWLPSKLPPALSAAADATILAGSLVGKKEDVPFLSGTVAKAMLPGAEPGLKHRGDQFINADNQEGPHLINEQH